MKEDAPANATGAAIPGSGDTGEAFPRRKKFAGKEVFVVRNETYLKSLQGKKKFKHYKSYVGECETGQAIREYATKNPSSPIIIEDELSGAMCFLRYGK